MKKRMIRLLSLALCLMSLVSLLPVSALAASTPGKPTDLKWNVRRYAYDGEVYSYETPGWVSFKAAKPYLSDGTHFIVKAYKNDKKVFETSYFYDKAYLEDNGGYAVADLTEAFESGSGTYHFTVKASADYDGKNSSSTATSKDYKYTKPTAKVGKPSNVKIEWPYVTWTGNGDSSPRYQCEIYYSEKKGGDKLHFYTYTGYSDSIEAIPGWLGSGYYSVRVRGYSLDITDKVHSSWVEVNDVYCKMKGPSVEISTVSSSGKPKITWEYEDDYSNKYVTKYEVYRATSKDGTYTKVKTTTGKSFTDTSATAGKKYYYKVKGLTANGKTSYSSIVSAYCDLARPTAKVSLTSKGNIKVSWDKVSGASKYAVYRAESEDGEYKLMKTTTSTSYTNTSADIGKTYYYKVQALHEKESANSAMSKVVSGTRKLATPAISISGISSTGKIKVSWDAVDDAATYKVFRATSSGGTYKELAEVSDTSYIDDSATAGKKYYYKVQAVAADPSFVSSKSGYKYRTCDLARPNVTITLKSNGDPRLTWDAIEGAEKYEIYRATSKSGTYEKIKTVTGTSFTNTTVKAGKTYYYKVKAIHSNSAANSAYSSIDKVSVSKNKGIQVWIPTNGGTKYHSRSGCSSMENPDKVYLDQALDLGFTACKKCY